MPVQSNRKMQLNIASNGSVGAGSLPPVTRWGKIDLSNCANVKLVGIYCHHLLYSILTTQSNRILIYSTELAGSAGVKRDPDKFKDLK